MNRLYFLTLMTRIAVVLIVLSLFLSPSPALAAKDRTPPTTPANLHTTAVTATSVTLAWNPSTDNSGSVTYRVQMVSPATERVTNQTSLTWSSLSPNSTYAFYVYAVDKAGNRSANSNTVTVTTPAADGAPTSPTNLHVTATTPTTVSLAWNPSTDNSGSVTYRVQIVSPSFAMETSQTSLTWTSLSPNTTYSIYVYAFDNSGNRSANSNTVTVTTPADTIPPTAPELSGSVLGPSQVRLTWTASRDDTEWWSPSYRVLLNGSPAAHVNWDGERWVHIRHLTPATTYTFNVQAYDTSGNIATSNTVTLTTEPSSDTVPPTAPTNLHLVSDQGGGEFYLGWTQSTDDVDPQYAIEYEIYVNGVLSPLAVSAGVDQDFVYARPECVNTFVVKAVDRTGNTSAPSNELTLFPWGQCP
jgi:chitodextrinase